jgi:acylphosphatase
MSESDKLIIRLHAVVEGRVQGVGFRYFVEEVAVNLGLSGWVRNRWDGSVEVTAEGERTALEKLTIALQRGPRASSVTKVEIEWQEATGEFKDFLVRMTA